MKDIENNPILQIQKFGQSICLDFISRGMLTSGELKEMIKKDGLCGVTSNPAIFEKTIDDSHDC
jgi:transaldolase